MEEGCPERKNHLSIDPSIFSAGRGACAGRALYPASDASTRKGLEATVTLDLYIFHDRAFKEKDNLILLNYIKNMDTHKEMSLALDFPETSFSQASSTSLTTEVA